MRLDRDRSFILDCNFDFRMISPLRNRLPKFNHSNDHAIHLRSTSSLSNIQITSSSVQTTPDLFGLIFHFDHFTLCFTLFTQFDRPLSAALHFTDEKPPLTSAVPLKPSVLISLSAASQRSIAPHNRTPIPLHQQRDPQSVLKFKLTCRGPAGTVSAFD